jgi:tol-pal system protein YbgF
MEKDLEIMKRRLNQLEIQKADAAGSSLANGDALQRDVAELQAGLDNLRVEFQSVNGRLDDLGRDNQQLADELRLVKDDVGMQFSSLVSRVDMLEQGTSGGASVPQGTLSTPVEKPKPAVETPEQLYQKALDKIRKENQFAEGRNLLKEFMAKYPQHDLYVNALYWSGEALYGEKQYELSILQLQDVISKHANHPKAAAAMLKQALAFNALGDGENARTTMQKLLEDYPESPQAESAKKYLEK